MSANPKFITPSSDYHVVQKGETLDSVSKKYSLSSEKLKLFNDLKSTDIYVGQKLYLYPKQRKKSDFVTVRKIPKTGFHIVKPRETVHRIAKMYDVSVFDILDFNDLNTYKLKTGTRIKLRESKAEYSKESIEKTKEIPQNISKSKHSIKEKSKIVQEAEKLFIPVKGTVTSEFGIRNGRPHKGIDIAASVGDPIHACLSGKVVYVGTQRGYGNVIILEHQNYVMSVYAHNETNFVRLGDRIKRGQPIASVGQTGTSSGPHLHFEYRVKGKAIDPRKVLLNL